MDFFINPKRLNFRTWRQRLLFILKYPFVRFGLWLGFPHVDHSFYSGYPGRLKLGKNVSTVNTLFNTDCGTITIGDDTIFGYNCMIITGQHRFYKGKRASMQADAKAFLEVPEEGNDIRIGSGCFICSGSIISRSVTIGDNVIIGAGSVVTKDIPSNCFACGNPAQVKRYFDQ